MAAPTPRIFTIPSSALFLPTLIKALVEGRLLPDFRLDRDPLTLARATLYLPTRRACRLARDVFLDVLAGEAAILPRITAIGDVDEDEIAFAGAASGALAAHALGLPPAFGGQERKLTADAIDSEMVKPDRTDERGAAGRKQSGDRAGAGIRSRPPARRHGNAASVLGPARRPCSGRHGQILGTDAQFPESRARGMAGYSQRLTGRSSPLNAATF